MKRCNTFNATPLMILCCYQPNEENNDIIKLLLCNIKNNKNDVSMSIAHYINIRGIMSGEVNSALRNCSALSNCLTFGNDAIAKMLIEYEADVNLKQGCLRTSLHHAAHGARHCYGKKDLPNFE